MSELHPGISGSGNEPLIAMGADDRSRLRSVESLPPSTVSSADEEAAPGLVLLVEHKLVEAGQEAAPADLWHDGG